MALQHVKNQDMSLVLSSDAKPRLKWTPELHQRFIDAVNQLGGADKATPKSLMRVMGIHGLTLYHLKSHLQKYRLGKSQQTQIHIENQQQANHRENQRIHFSGNFCHDLVNRNLPIAQAFEMQMEVQRKLDEQIEVQRHLQLRIEAQGKYLKSVLMKAQETLAGYNSSAGLVHSKAELSRLVSMVEKETSCPSSSLSVLTDIEGPTLKETEKKTSRGTRISLDRSSLMSSDRWGPKEEETETENTVVLSLMETNTGQNGGSRNRDIGRKRSRSNISDAVCVEQEQPYVRRSMTDATQSGIQSRKFKSCVTLDLNI